MRNARRKIHMDGGWEQWDTVPRSDIPLPEGFILAKAAEGEDSLCFCAEANLPMTPGEATRPPMLTLRVQPGGRQYCAGLTGYGEKTALFCRDGAGEWQFARECDYAADVGRLMVEVPLEAIGPVESYSFNWLPSES